MHGKCILSHIVRSKFILKSHFSHALLNKDVSWSTKRGERTWQSLPWHIENVFEQQKAFLLQIEARLNQRNMIHKMNSVLIRQKWMRIKRNWKKSQTFQKTWLWDHTCLWYEKEAVLCYFCRKSKKTRLCGWCGGLMVSALNSGANGLGSSPGRGHCVVFLGKTLYSHSASLHPGV